MVHLFSVQSVTSPYCFMTITLKKILHKNTFRIGIFFPATATENGLAKGIGALYSKTFHCWHLPYDKESFQLVQKAFKNHSVEIENTATSSVVLQTPEPSPTVQQLVKKKLLIIIVKKYYLFLI